MTTRGTERASIVVERDDTRDDEVERLREELAAAREREAALREQLSLFRGALDAFPESLNIRDAQFRHYYANPKALEMMGVQGSVEIARAERQWRYVFEDGNTRAQRENLPTWRALHGGGVCRGRALLIDDNLERRAWLEGTAAPITDERGETIGVINFVRDITEQLANQEALDRSTAQLRERAQELSETLARLRATQKQLVESEKMAALGGLVAGVAHEINTPVGVGVTAASALEERTRRVVVAYQGSTLTRAALEDYLDIAGQSSAMILANLQRASELIQSFKQVSVDHVSEERRRFEVEPYVARVLLSLRHNFKRAAHEVALEVEPGLTLTSYPGALAQIITNLVSNAFVHAFGDGARGRVVLGFEQRGDERVALTVRDDGRGIAPGDVPRIFEPFFTTRRGLGGCGLGLHIVYNLVTQKLGGVIQCESAVGHGTRFSMELPRRAPDRDDLDPEAGERPASSSDLGRA